MIDPEDIVINLAFYRSGDEAVAAVKNRWPHADVTVVKVADLEIPEGIEACSWSGSGNTTAVKRTDYSAIISRHGEVTICRLYEFWTASDSTPEHINDLFFWDVEKDEKYELQIPVADV